jgi:hypothetical protein
MSFPDDLKRYLLVKYAQEPFPYEFSEQDLYTNIRQDICNYETLKNMLPNWNTCFQNTVWNLPEWQSGGLNAKPNHCLLINSGNKCLQGISFPVEHKQWGKRTCNFLEKVFAKNIMDLVGLLREFCNTLLDRCSMD